MISASAPGRVNLIGEHTDYNEGFVLPLAIPQRTTVEVEARSDDLVRVRSAAARPAEAEFRLGEAGTPGEWIEYVRGALAVLVEAGFAVGGLDLWIRSDVPIGSGLSSSAALLVAVLRAARELWGLSFDEHRLVRLAHRAETVFVGVPVGILDPMACAFAGERTALFLDTRTLAAESVALPAAAALVVVDSGQRHAHASGGYRIRRQECDEAARRLGIRALRDATVDGAGALPPPLDRRARHVVTEDERVLAAVAAMRADDLRELGALLDASHASMRDDFECSTPEIDRLVEVARAVPGVRGARLTGGGFGGSIVALADADVAPSAAAELLARARRIEGLNPRVLVP